MAERIDELIEILDDSENLYGEVINELTNSFNYNSEYADAIAKLNNHIEVIVDLKEQLNVVQSDIDYIGGPTDDINDDLSMD